MYLYGQYTFVYTVNALSCILDNMELYIQCLIFLTLCWTLSSILRQSFLVVEYKTCIQ